MRLFPGRELQRVRKQLSGSRWHLWQTQSFCHGANPSPSGLDSFAFWEDAPTPAVPQPARNAFIPEGRQLRLTKDFHRSVNKYWVQSCAASTVQQEVFSFSAGTISGKGGVIPDLYRGEAGYSCSFECNYLQFLLFFCKLTQTLSVKLIKHSSWLCMATTLP